MDKVQAIQCSAISLKVRKSVHVFTWQSLVPADVKVLRVLTVDRYCSRSLIGTLLAACYPVKLLYADDERVALSKGSDFLKPASLPNPLDTLATRDSSAYTSAGLRGLVEARNPPLTPSQGLFENTYVHHLGDTDSLLRQSTQIIN